MKTKVTGVELLIALIASGLDSSLTVAPSLVPAVLTEAQAGAPPIIWLWPEGQLIMGINHGS